jgi:hypothetical protein
MAQIKIPYEIREWSGGFDIYIPEFVVDELTSPGQEDGIARRYVEEMAGFTERFSQDTIVDLLVDYGAWTEAEMREWEHRQLCETLLWVAAGNGKNGCDPVEFETINGHRLLKCYIGD